MQHSDNERDKAEISAPDYGSPILIKYFFTVLNQDLNTIDKHGKPLKPLFWF